MPISMKTKTVYTAVVILVQIYFVYAATLYVDVHSLSILWVLLTAAVSALGTIYYVFVQANKDEVGGYNGDFSLDERRRIG